MWEWGHLTDRGWSVCLLMSQFLCRIQLPVQRYICLSEFSNVHSSFSSFVVEYEHRTMLVIHQQSWTLTYKYKQKNGMCSLIITNNYSYSEFSLSLSLSNYMYCTEVLFFRRQMQEIWLQRLFPKRDTRRFKSRLLGRELCKHLLMLNCSKFENWFEK